MPYTLPTAAQLRTRYPAFAAVVDATIDAAIAQAARSVDSSWTEGDYQPAIMALAAHQMTVEGIGADVSAQLAGFKRLRVGPLELERDLSAAATSADDLQSTAYGRTFAMLLLQNRGGPRVAVAASL